MSSIADDAARSYDDGPTGASVPSLITCVPTGGSLLLCEIAPDVLLASTRKSATLLMDTFGVTALCGITAKRSIVGVIRGRFFLDQACTECRRRASRFAKETVDISTNCRIATDVLRQSRNRLDERFGLLGGSRTNNATGGAASDRNTKAAHACLRTVPHNPTRKCCSTHIPCRSSHTPRKYRGHKRR